MEKLENVSKAQTTIVTEFGKNPCVLKSPRLTWPEKLKNTQPTKDSLNYYSLDKIFICWHVLAIYKHDLQGQFKLFSPKFSYSTLFPP